MATGKFSFTNFLIRAFFALLLVFVTYNPSEYSYYHWLLGSIKEGIQPLVVFAGVALIIGWAIFLRATIISLGIIGLILAFAFFGTLLWVIISSGLVSIENVSILTYIILVLVSLVLAIGMSWSHIRRRMSGQLDVNDSDEDVN